MKTKTSIHKGHQKNKRKRITDRQGLQAQIVGTWKIEADKHFAMGCDL